jgi:hypothetical protein
MPIFVGNIAHIAVPTVFDRAAFVEDIAVMSGNPVPFSLEPDRGFVPVPVATVHLGFAHGVS